MFRFVRHIIIMTLLIIIGLVVVAYSALWLFSFKKYSVSFGISFSPDYAAFLGLDWKKTYEDILSDLKPKFVRVAVPWNDVESEKGRFSFQKIDFLMNEAAKHDAKVILVVGQKTPRWPECHFPNWFSSLSAEDRKKEIFSYVEKTVNRYKNHKALEYWQVENEPFIKFDFGVCEGYDEKIVGEEAGLVRSLDPKHEVVVTDSGELSLWYSASKTGDILGSTLYRIVRTPSDLIWRYGYMPAGTYKIRARLFGNDYDHFFISELQAEPWFNGGSALDTPVPVQEKTMNPDQLQKNINYAEYAGASRAYFWGVEWWYWMKTKQNDSRYWDLGRETIIKSS